MKMIVVSLLALLFACVNSETFAIWHCGDDGCTWGYEPDFSNSSSWIVDRGDGQPTFNLVIFSFVDPLALLQGTTDDNNINGVPRGMTQNTVHWFTSKGIQVMISIGGASLANNWDQALQQDAETLAKNAAALSQNLNVGIEIDYENENDDTDNLLDTFVSTYRSIIPYDESNQAATLTVDLGGGLGWLDDLSAHASKWLSNGQLNWENEMVDYYNTIGEATSNWTTHLNGQDGVPPVPSNQMGVSIFENEACQNYEGSVTQQAIPWIKQHGIRGLFLWAQGSDLMSSSSSSSVMDQDCPGLRQASYDILGGGSSTSSTNSGSSGNNGNSNSGNSSSGNSNSGNSNSGNSNGGNSSSNGGGSSSNGNSNGNGSSSNGGNNGGSSSNGGSSNGGSSNGGGSNGGSSSNGGSNGGSNGSNGGSNGKFVL